MIRFDQEICGNLDTAMQREWLETKRLFQPVKVSRCLWWTARTSRTCVRLPLEDAMVIACGLALD